MSHHFDNVTIIYNPNSTNDAAKKAEHFSRLAKKASLSVTLTPTEYAGHAGEIARKIVEQHQSPLLISASGDGGYNELINGVMQAKKHTQKNPVVAIIAAGNANDHKRTTRGDTPLLGLIKAGKPQPLDLLRLQAGKIDRYAHSYIGFGFTPKVGRQLNRHKLDRIKELIIVFRALAKFKPIAIKHGGKTEYYANLLCANINSMAKFLKLDVEQNNLSDGKFELISEPWHSKSRLVLHFLKSIITGHNHSTQLAEYSFTTTSLLDTQLDGEIETIEKLIKVKVSVEKKAVLSLY